MILSLTQNQLLEQVNKTIRTAISQFYYQPHLFFNERGIQDYLFAVFYRNKFFSSSNLTLTKDGKKVNLVHSEYQSAERIPEKWRACYDMVILNPEFIKKYDYSRVTNKLMSDYTKCQYQKGDLLAVFELKLIQQKNKTYFKQLEKDYNSLMNAKESLLKYMIVFSSIKDDLDFLRDKEWTDELRLIYIKVYFDKKNKKCVEILIKPNNFLNLPSNWIRK